MYESERLWQEFYRRLRALAQSLVDPATNEVNASFVHHVDCAVCGSSRKRVRVRVDGFTYVTCEACSFVYLDPQLRTEVLKTAYNDDAVRDFFFKELLLPFVERDQEPEFRERLRALRSYTAAVQPRLLDVGCAAGNFLQLAQAEGIVCEGLELNDDYIAYIHKERNVIVRQVLLEDAGYEEGTFDMVSVWDVLEHIPDPRRFLRETGRVLKPGGVVGLTTINHTSLNERLLRERWRYYMPPDHVCSFSPGILRRLLTEEGFDVLSIRHQPMFEVLADVWFPGLTRPSASAALNKVRKLVYLVLAGVYQLKLTLLRQGDLLTVYARKR